jgi:hypothetical protein
VKDLTDTACTDGEILRRLRMTAGAWRAFQTSYARLNLDASSDLVRDDDTILADCKL